MAALIALFKTGMAFLSVNKLLLIVAAGGIVAAVGVFLWKDAQVSRREAAVAKQQRDIAVEAATANANTIEEVKRLSRVNGEAMAKFLADQRARQDELTVRLQEINNAPLAAACSADPVLDRTLDRVWGKQGNRGPDGQAGTGGDRPGIPPAAVAPRARQPSRSAPARRAHHRAVRHGVAGVRVADRPDSPATRSAGAIAVSWQRHRAA